jgi:hypothetical protein
MFQQAYSTVVRFLKKCLKCDIFRFLNMLEHWRTFRNKRINQLKRIKNSTPKTSFYKQSKFELLNWFEVNKLNPYPSNSDLDFLALKTKLKENKIKKWIGNRRTRSNIKKSDANGTHLSNEDRSIMKTFYSTKRNHPGPDDLLLLERVTQKDRNKIRQWFNNERFREKFK